MIRNISLTGILLALGAAVSVVAFGAVSTLAFAPVQAGIAIFAAAIFWRRGFPSLSRSTAALLLLLLLIPALQIIPLPRSLVSLLSPHRVSLADALLGHTISIPRTLTLSWNAYETQTALLRLICYMLVFLLAVQAYDERGGQGALSGALITIGVFEAIYGCSQFLTGWPRMFNGIDWVPATEATGTYINRDHYAGLLEMILPFLLARILLRVWTDTGSRQSMWKQLLLSPFASHLLRDMALFALLSMALVYSGSRMGFIGATAGFFTTVAIVLLQRRHRSVFVILILTLFLPVAYVLWVGVAPTVERFSVMLQVGASNESRITIWRDTLALIRDYPVLGAGLGTYRWTSLHYQTALFPNFYEHAHGDYLEFAADIGIPAALLLFACLWILVIKVARRAVLLEHSRDKILATACAAAMTALLIHAIADFNFQIPANAYLFSWIAGTAAALGRKPLHDASSRRVKIAHSSVKQMAY